MSCHSKNGKLVGGDWLPSILFSQKYRVAVIILIDEVHHFSEGWGKKTTNQYIYIYNWYNHVYNILGMHRVIKHGRWTPGWSFGPLDPMDAPQSCLGWLGKPPIVMGATHKMEGFYFRENPSKFHLFEWMRTCKNSCSKPHVTYRLHWLFAATVQKDYA